MIIKTLPLLVAIATTGIATASAKHLPLGATYNKENNELILLSEKIYPKSFALTPTGYKFVVSHEQSKSLLAGNGAKSSSNSGEIKRNTIRINGKDISKQEVSYTVRQKNNIVSVAVDSNFNEPHQSGTDMLINFDLKAVDAKMESQEDLIRNSKEVVLFADYRFSKEAIDQIRTNSETMSCVLKGRPTFTVRALMKPSQNMPTEGDFSPTDFDTFRVLLSANATGVSSVDASIGIDSERLAVKFDYKPQCETMSLPKSKNMSGNSGSLVTMFVGMAAQSTAEVAPNISASLVKTMPAITSVMTAPQLPASFDIEIQREIFDKEIEAIYTDEEFKEGMSFSF